MLYHYLAADKSGKINEGEYDADSLSRVLEHLSGRGLHPVNVEVLRPKRGKFQVFFSGISVSDKVFLTKYLALMLKVGTDLLSAINILITDFDKPAVKNLLLEIRENLTKGQPFHMAFVKYSRSFSPVFINLIKAAEASGNLQQTFDSLSGSLEKEAQLRSRVRSALIYPVIILAASLGIFVFLTTFALPKIAGVFLESGVNPPVFSRIVFGVGLYVNDHIAVLAPSFIVFVLATTFFFWKVRLGRKLLQRILAHTPVIKKLFRDLAVQRFASTFSSLMRAGLPIVDALNISADVVGSDEFGDALRRVGEEGLTKGLTIGDAFRRETIFPRVVTNLVAISEKAGHLDEVLETIADFYADNIDANIKTLISFLEPALLIGMGLLVGLIAISIIVPIYQLTSQF